MTGLNRVNPVLYFLNKFLQLANFCNSWFPLSLDIIRVFVSVLHCPAFGVYLFSFRSISVLLIVAAFGQKTRNTVFPWTSAKVVCDRWQASRQFVKLCDIPTGYAVPAELVYKFNCSCNRGAASAFCGRYVPGRGTTILCCHTGRPNLEHHVVDGQCFFMDVHRHAGCVCGCFFSADILETKVER